MSTEIYYFSGTGNSLHVAKELQKRIPKARLIPIMSLVNKESVTTRGETDDGILASSGWMRACDWAAS